MQNTTHGADGARALFAFLGTTDNGMRGAGFVRRAIDRALALYPEATLEITGTRATVADGNVVAITLDCAPLIPCADIPRKEWTVCVGHTYRGDFAAWLTAAMDLTEIARDMGALFVPISPLDISGPAPEAPVTCELCHDSHRGQLARPCHVHGCECYCNRGVRP
jgi:hypothetical protein